MSDIIQGSFVQYAADNQATHTAPAKGTIGFVYDATAWDVRVLWVGYELGPESEVMFERADLLPLSRDQFGERLLAVRTT